MLVHIFINGEKRKVHCQPDAMLLEVLRDAGCKSVKCDRETMTSGGMLTESQAVQLNNGDVLLFMRNTGTGDQQRRWCDVDKY